MAFTTVSIAKALRIKPAQLSDRLHRLVKKNAFYRSPSMVGFFSNNGEYIYSLERQYIFDYYFQLLRRLAPNVAKAYDHIIRIGEPMSSIDILQEFIISEPTYQRFFGFFYKWKMLKKMVVSGFCDLIVPFDYPDEKLKEIYEERKQEFIDYNNGKIEMALNSKRMY